jgi:hypothetical protein
VHATVVQLRAHAQRLNPSGGWDDCLGGFQPPPRYLHGDDPGWVRNGYAGTLRFAEPYVTSEIVAHELIHASLQIYRMNVDACVTLGSRVTEKEENLAYIYGELYAELEKKILGRP